MYKDAHTHWSGKLWAAFWSSCGRERGTKAHCVLVKKQTFYVMKCKNPFHCDASIKPNIFFSHSRWRGRSNTSKSTRTPQKSFSLLRARASETQKPVHVQRCPQCHHAVSVHVKGSPLCAQVDQVCSSRSVHTLTAGRPPAGLLWTGLLGWHHKHLKCRLSFFDEYSSIMLINNIIIIMPSHSSLWKGSLFSRDVMHSVLL